jgi:hypothetical protein
MSSRGQKKIEQIQIKIYLFFDLLINQLNIYQVEYKMIESRTIFISGRMSVKTSSDRECRQLISFWSTYLLDRHKNLYRLF